MQIGHAIDALKMGKRVYRSGWNGKNMWLALVPASQWDLAAGSEASLSNQQQLGHAGYAYRGPFVAMRAADGMLVPWLASQTDLLAEDWYIAQ